MMNFLKLIDEISIYNITFESFYKNTLYEVG